MAISVPSRAPSLPVKSLGTAKAKLSNDVNDSEKSDAATLDRDGVSLVFECIAAAGLSDKEAAYTMAMDPAQLSRIKSGQQRLPFDALWRLPTRFWSEFQERVGEAKGLSERHLLKVRAARIAELVKLLLEGVA